MAATTGSASTKATTDKEGVLIKGRDVIMLDAPEILPSPKTPLLTEAQDIVGAINELKKLSSGEGGDDWQPPADWIPVPEPGAWEANFLIEIRNVFTFAFIFLEPVNGWLGYGKLIIDWGDGTVETIEGYAIDENGYAVGTRRDNINTHTYKNPGQYVIKAVTDNLSCGLAATGDTINSYGNRGVNLLIAKLGKNICCKLPNPYGTVKFGAFNGSYRLHWLKVNGSSEFANYFLSNCGNLRRLDLSEPIVNVPDGCFSGVTFPSNFDFSKIKKISTAAFMNAKIPVKLTLPECTEFAAGAFDYCPLEEINLPKCEKIEDSAFRDYRFSLRAFYASNCISVGKNAFYGQRSLEAAVFAENCVFGTNCFQSCDSLYPRPDGSTN